MIIVLGYNNSETEFLNKIFEDTRLEFKYSLLEGDITQATKIILPNPTNLNSAYRRVNLMNLFSLLRLLKIPILGINDGFRLMCNKLVDRYKMGLGFFDLDIICHDQESLEAKYTSGYLSLVKNSKLLDDKINGSKIIFNTENQPSLNKLTSVKITTGDNDFTFIFERENYFALAADLNKNMEICEDVVKNFIFI